MMTIRSLIFSGLLCTIAIPHETSACSTPELRKEIPLVVQKGIDSLNLAYHYMNSACLVDEKLNCVGFNATGTLLEAKSAFRSFNATLKLYDEVLEDPDYSFECNAEEPVCSCSAIKNRIESMNTTYYGPYANDWSKFIAGQGNCTALATDLRAIVTSFFCDSLQTIFDIDDCVTTCSFRCIPEDQDTFRTTVTEQIKEANDLADAAVGQYLDQCDVNFDCTAANMTAIVTELAEAATIYNNVVDEYNQFLNIDDYTPPPCLLANSTCDCETMFGLFEDLVTIQRLNYTVTWREVSSGVVDECDVSMKKLRDIAESMSCLCRKIIADYQVCQERCQQCNILICDRNQASSRIQSADSATGFLAGLVRRVLPAMDKECKSQERLL